MTLIKKITIYTTSFLVFIFLFLLILGLKERRGYFSDINLNILETLKINNISIDDVPILIQANQEQFTNYIFTNINITNYVYNFKVNYYSKVFRNSDIYDVYPNFEKIKENNVNILNITMLQLGEPWGTIISDILLYSDIDNLFYKLKLKFNFIFYFFSIIIIIYLFLFLKKRYYFTFIFLLFLILPNIIYFLLGNYFDNTNYENRRKLSSYALDIHNIDKSFIEFEIYYNDNLPFKNELVKLKNLIDINFFYNIINSSGRLLGKDKWLFFNSSNLSQDFKKLDEQELLDLKNKILSFANKLEKENIDFILLICPKKEFIYPEYLPEYFPEHSYDYTIEQFIDYMQDSGVKILYLKDELLKYKSKYQLYYKYDYHWNKLGAYIGYSKLMELLALDYNNIDTLSILSNKYNSYNKSFLHEQYNDIAKGLALSKNKLFTDDYIFDISNYYTNSLGYYTGSVSDWATFDTFGYSNYYNKRLFIVRDSYFVNMVDYIAPLFFNISFVHLRNFLSKTFKKGKKPDIFILEFLGSSSNKLISIIDSISKIKLEDIYIEEINK